MNDSLVVKSRTAAINLPSLIVIICALLGGCVSANAGANHTARADVGSADDGMAESTPPAPHTVKEAIDANHALSSRNAEALAQFLDLLNSWYFRPEDEKAANELTLNLMAELRQAVEREVASFYQVALQANTGKEASIALVRAGQLIALYPISNNHEVIAAATRLSTEQADVVLRVEALRRQRYNRWAAGVIEEAVQGYNTNTSMLHPTAVIPKLMDSLVSSLGTIDPTLLEPAVLDLYTYVLNRTKDKISEQDKVDLTKRLTDSSNIRKELSDF